MSPRKTLAPWLAALACVALSACHENTHLPGVDADADTDVDLEAGTEDADHDADEAPDADEGDAPPDSDLPAGGAPMSMIVQEILVLEDRMCDFDGDGTGDNAIADLGSPGSAFLLMALNNVASEGIRRGDVRLMLHYPWVDDPAGPEDPDTNLIVMQCVDSDDPRDTSDDFSGDELYFASPKSLDACGEPSFVFVGAEIHAGTGVTDAGTLPIPVDSVNVVLHEARVEATIQPHGAAATLAICGYSLVRDLGREPGLEEAGDLSLLEILLAGGVALGIPMLPGLTPDIDVDRDGLERFTFDETGRITACIDGDTTVIPGRDCWADERIADAFSMAASMSAVRARFGGRAEGWQEAVEGTCESPPSQSLFDPR